MLIPASLATIALLSGCAVGHSRVAPTSSPTSSAVEVAPPVVTAVQLNRILGEVAFAAKQKMAIQIKDLEQLKVMRRAGLLVGQTLQLLRENIKAGMTTDALDAIAAANIKRGGGTSNFLGYHGYPKTICVSVNEEIVHGIPGPRVLDDGDDWP